MGSIILCHKKKAKEPYEITRIHRKIYTLEELCYYMCNHLYLVDYTIMNDKLCDWLEEELGLGELSSNLKRNLKQHNSAEQFILTILAYSSIYTTGELSQIQDVLEKLRNQKPVEKKKYKADNLLNNGALKAAILIYKSILDEETDESIDKGFCGKVYGCLGAAYGRLFLYEEAAKMYEKAYRISEDDSILQAYVYACTKYMTKEEFSDFLRKSPGCQVIAEQLKEIEAAISAKKKAPATEELLEKWKVEYRQVGSGE